MSAVCERSTQAPTMEVRREGSMPNGCAAWAVFEGDRRVSGVFHERSRADDRLDAMLRRSARTQRPCLCCGAAFLSEGAHNRLCGGCRQRTADVSPMEPTS